MTDLNENEYVLKELMPATSHQLAEETGFSLSYIYDLIGLLRDKGYPVEQDRDGRYYVRGEDEPDDQPTQATAPEPTPGQKSAVTRKVRKQVAEIEHHLKEVLDDTDPAIAENVVTNPGAQNLIIHRTDDHFGELNTNQHGDVLFNSEIAEERVRHVFDETFRIAAERENAGVDFDGASVLMGGDIITGEDIHDEQPHEIDEPLHDQIDRASRVYMEGIRDLADYFPHVKVVCQPGNHGRLGSGNPTNADGLLYMMLDKMVRESNIDNVTFLQSDRSYYVDFQIRDWNAHLRHGHDRSLEHIGTSAGKQRWLSWLVDHGFDIAFRGHYHVYKEEPINGRPVVMGGSILPQTEYEESNALSGRAMSAVHGASDEYPLQWTEKIYFD